MTFPTIVTVAARIMEGAGIFVMVFGVLIACVLAATKLRAGGGRFTRCVRTSAAPFCWGWSFWSEPTSFAR